MNQKVYVVIMAGGTGTRFWPYSRNDKPKQFLDVLGTGRSLLQMTFDRFSGYTETENIYLVSNEIYADVIEEQLPELSHHQVLLEPVKRNTAPCVAYAAYKIKQKDPDAILIFTPADHAIFQEQKFQDVIKKAVDGASSGEKLITIGIKPHRPETGYGYIQHLEDDGDVKPVKTFTEKPQLELAETFLASGDFLWNAGIFVWSVAAITNAFGQHQPEIAEIFDTSESYFSDDEKAFIEKSYSIVKSISIDYAIMEKATNVFVVMGDFGWSDLGSWNALHEIRDKDEHGNVVEAETILYQCKNNFIKAEKGKLVVLQDLDGYLVSDLDDVLLVCKKDDAAIFKSFVTDVKTLKGDKYI
ncbi:MAG: mannose-1-phosphate guanylyltransferase [Cytophagales bacterium]|nr:mannose-1-phosphate guanylyltransferase [Cytophagales bacterium]